MSGKIYKITNLINKKIYIGKTTGTLKDRFKKHAWEDKSDNHFRMPIKKAIQKYGQENFTIDLIEECNVEEIDDREIYWISFYDTYKTKNGYNCTPGGEGGNGKRKLSKEQELNVIKLKFDGYSSEELSKEYNVNKTTISNIIKRHGYRVPSRQKLSDRVNVDDFINDVNLGLTTVELMNKYKIKYCSVFNLKRKYIKYNTSKSVQTLSLYEG